MGLFDNFEVKLDSKDAQAINILMGMKEYQSYVRYLGKVLDKNRDKLEEKDDDLIRGECKRLRKLLRLSHDFPKC